VPADGAAIARALYDDEDTDAFYSLVWGGEDIHMGTYDAPDVSVATASRRTVERLCELLGGIPRTARILDIGAGYGGAARHLAARYGCRVECLNLSERQNLRNQRLNAESRRTGLVSVCLGTFEQLPYADATFDIVWCQDALIHSQRRRDVLAEVERVLVPAGSFAFTDAMQADDCPSGALAGPMQRLGVRAPASPRFYREAAQGLGFRVERLSVESSILVRHYGQLLQELERHRGALEDTCAPGYVDRVAGSLRLWLEAARAGHLVWGMGLLTAPPTPAEL